MPCGEKIIVNGKSVYTYAHEKSVIQSLQRALLRSHNLINSALNHNLIRSTEWIEDAKGVLKKDSNYVGEVTNDDL